MYFQKRTLDMSVRPLKPDVSILLSDESAMALGPDMGVASSDASALAPTPGVTSPSPAKGAAVTSHSAPLLLATGAPSIPTASTRSPDVSVLSPDASAQSPIPDMGVPSPAAGAMSLSAASARIPDVSPLPLQGRSRCPLFAPVLVVLCFLSSMDANSLTPSPEMDGLPSDASTMKPNPEMTCRHRTRVRSLMSRSSTNPNVICPWG